MYQNNIYIKNHKAIATYGKDINVSLDMYDAEHGHPLDKLARAQYKHWRVLQTGVPELLSQEDRSLLDL